jgi:hypothetical protein
MFTVGSGLARAPGGHWVGGMLPPTLGGGLGHGRCDGGAFPGDGGVYAAALSQRCAGASVLKLGAMLSKLATDRFDGMPSPPACAKVFGAKLKVLLKR